jgi:hypothetical protein
MWTFEVNFTEWFGELQDILEKKKMWSASAPMRPQIQITRHIGLPIQLTDLSLIKQNIQQTVFDLLPMVNFLGK